MNPIRKIKTLHIKNPRPGGTGLACLGYWYAVCPKCEDHVKTWYHGGSRSTRKQAKDALYKHLKKCDGTIKEPGIKLLGS